jgi:uroporphyrinogen decarboxylase
VRDWGVVDQWEGDPEGTRRYTKRVISVPEDWRKVLPLPISSSSLKAQLDCLRRVVGGLEDGAPVLQTVFSPLAQAKNLAGESRLFEHLHSHPEDVEAALSSITTTTIAFVDAAIQTGISGIFYAIQHGTYRHFDREGYARFGEPFDRRILEAAGELWCNLLHLHGVAIIFELAETYPVQIVNWHDQETPPDLAQGKARIRGAACGGLRRIETLVLGEPAQVQSEARSAIQSVQGRGLVLGAGCVTPISAPRANLLAARRAVENFA